MNDMHGNSLKTLRQDLLARRKSFIADASYAACLDKLTVELTHFLAQQNPLSVALYAPIQAEPDLRPTLLHWAAQSAQRQLALPFARPDKHLDFFLWNEDDPLVLSKHGVPEPNSDNPASIQVIPDCILIPCVGWSSSHDGHQHHYWRLGYGGGYFDRTLSRLKKVKPTLKCVGVGFDWQKLDDAQWQNQTHDEPLDCLLTESGTKS